MLEFLKRNTKAIYIALVFLISFGLSLFFLKYEIESKQAFPLHSKVENIHSASIKDTGSIIDRKKDTIKDNQEVINEELQGGFSKIGDLTYKFSDRKQLSEISILSANEIYGDKPEFGVDFSSSYAGDPLFIESECKDAPYDIVPLYSGYDIAGLVLLNHTNSDTVSVGVIRPTPVAQTGFLLNYENKVTQRKNNYEKELFPPITHDQAKLLVLKHIKESVDTMEFPQIKGKLVYTCVNEYPLAPPTAPFYAFHIKNNKYYVNSIDGQIITQNDINEFSKQNKAIGDELEQTKTDNSTQ